MAINKNHQTHMDMMSAFEKADKTTPRNTALGGGSYGMASTGMPRSSAQMSSVKKAAKASALARDVRAQARVANKATSTGTAAGNVAATASPTPKPGVRTGGLGLNTVGAKKGLLGL